MTVSATCPGLWFLHSCCISARLREQPLVVRVDWPLAASDAVPANSQVECGCLVLCA